MVYFVRQSASEGMQMVEFFESTWFLWWIAAVLVILSWFHTASITRKEAAEFDEVEYKESTFSTLSSSRS